MCFGTWATVRASPHGGLTDCWCNTIRRNRESRLLLVQDHHVVLMLNSVLPSSVGDRAQTTPRTSWSKFSCRNLPDSLSMLNATCFRCGEDAKHLITSHLQDAECASTICRPIHEWAKAGNSTSVRKFKLQCRLCPWDRHVLPDTILQYLTEFGKHVAQHSLRSCTQKIFRGHPKEFWWHMQKQHKATISVEQVFTQDRWRLDPWESEHTPENYDV
jgi:hypothetical protein